MSDRNPDLDGLAEQLVTQGDNDGRFATRPPEPVSPAAFQAGKPAGPAGIQAERPLPPWELPGAFRLDCEPHRGNLLWWMGAASVTCGVVPLVGLGVLALALGLTTWYLARHDLAQMRKGLMDPSGERLTRNARDGSIVAVVLAPLITLYALAILLG
jgi:hypothetical protein